MKKSKQKKEKKAVTLKRTNWTVWMSALISFLSLSPSALGAVIFLHFLPCIRALTTSFFFSLFPSALSEFFFCVVCYDNTITVATLL